MSYDRYRVSVETLENGFVVEVPDMAEIAKKRSKEKKDMPMYFGDCTKKFAAKNVKDVLAQVKTALEQIPEGEYDAAFKEAAGKK